MRRRRWARWPPGGSGTGWRATRQGITGGAKLATGGGRPDGLDRGWYVEPTVFGSVDNSSVIAQEEIFGPVLSVIPAQDKRDAVRIANNTDQARLQALLAGKCLPSAMHPQHLPDAGWVTSY